MMSKFKTATLLILFFYQVNTKALNEVRMVEFLLTKNI